MTALSPSLYHQELASLLLEPEGEVGVVGQISSDLKARLPQALLTDKATYPFGYFFEEVSDCLESHDGPPPGSRILLLMTSSSMGKLASQIGSICQRYPNQVLIELQHDPDDKIVAQAFSKVCVAMGFRFALHCVSDTVEHQLYEYRLKNYKQAPDWLNARFWAHPERFNTR